VTFRRLHFQDGRRKGGQDLPHSGANPLLHKFASHIRQVVRWVHVMFLALWPLLDGTQVFESRGIQNSSTMRPNKPKGMITMTPRKETRCPTGEGSRGVPFNNVRRRAHSLAESCSIIPTKAARQGWVMGTPKRFGGAVIRRGEFGLSAKNGCTRSLSARFLADPSAAPHGRTSEGGSKNDCFAESCAKGG